ncbi:hypothetical protein HXX76_006111 [Chlamydomonas incerta]|uniref:Uncharacterized protein n=1 Tax=Chlamydomonas incerta TaxID=51695 RepID=A0A835T4X9_CHLIN|nr:hypothetical protein HXX76_006111 [Chlamydomonas incerta]|eukprot:KAG2437461.1 hypothetical protein HXX76_006111 [Chlamydomonas incerta]
MEQIDITLVSDLARALNLDAASELNAASAFTQAKPGLRAYIRGQSLQSKQVELLTQLMQDVGRKRDQPGRGAPTGTAEGRARIPVIARYFITDAKGARCFTPLFNRILATYCHGSHSSLQVGQEIEVLVNDSTPEKQRRVKARVFGLHKGLRVLFCSTAEPIDAPSLDISVRAAEPYIILGCSDMSQAEPFSTSHGSISTTTPDICGFIRGDTAALSGEWGGGCFAAETGKLVAMTVGADTKHGDRAVLLLVSALLALLLDKHMEEMEELMPDMFLSRGGFATTDEQSS